MKAEKLCHQWGKRPTPFSTFFSRHFNMPSLLVIPQNYLLWGTVKGAKSWMAAAPVEWHPEPHALFKNVSSACACTPRTPWQVEHWDLSCMITCSSWHDWRKKGRRQNILDWRQRHNVFSWNYLLKRLISCPLNLTKIKWHFMWFWHFSLFPVIKSHYLNS